MKTDDGISFDAPPLDAYFILLVKEISSHQNSRVLLLDVKGLY